MRFLPTVDCDKYPEDGSPAPEIDDNLAWLRTLYFSCHATFVCSMVIEMAASNDSNADAQCAEAVKRLAFGVVGTIDSTRQYMKGKFHPMVWTQSQR